MFVAGWSGLRSKWNRKVSGFAELHKLRRDVYVSESC